MDRYSSRSRSDKLVGRRRFLGMSGKVGLTAAGLALLNGCATNPFSALGSAKLETTTIRVDRSDTITCIAPTYLAGDILKESGFVDVKYVDGDLGAVVPNEDIAMVFGANILTQIEKGDPVVCLAGIHSGCFEVFGTDRVNSISDLRGKTIAIPELGSGRHLFLASLLAYVGMKPSQDVNWAIHTYTESKALLASGQVDAYVGFPPEPQELRAEKIGHVIMSAMMDKPWSQYYCCYLAVNRSYLEQNPVATRAAFRAVMKATDICALQPERAARLMVDRGYTANYDYALEMMQSIGYNRWREYDPVDTLRFYGLRLLDSGLLKTNPDELIQRGTDFRLLNELKKEPAAASLASSVRQVTQNWVNCSAGKPTA